MLFDAQLKQIFTENSVIAIVGAKDKAGSPVDHVGRYLLAQGYEILPVHPIRHEVWGLPTYKSIQDLPKSLILSAFLEQQKHVLNMQKKF